MTTTRERRWITEWSERSGRGEEGISYVLARRTLGEPLDYCLGESEFYGLRLVVTRDVLIPRPETEGLVERALSILAGRPDPRVLDAGTGSGAIAVALARARPDARVAAVDISEAALAVARRNAETHEVTIRFERADLWPEGEGDYDLVVANLPYISDADVLPDSVAAFEPALALYGGPDGYGVIRRLLATAPPRLAPGGTMLLEVCPEAPARLARPESVEKFDFSHDLAGRIRYLQIQWTRS